MKKYQYQTFGLLIVGLGVAIALQFRHVEPQSAPAPGVVAKTPFGQSHGRSFTALPAEVPLSLPAEHSTQQIGSSQSESVGPDGQAELGRLPSLADVAARSPELPSAYPLSLSPLEQPEPKLKPQSSFKTKSTTRLFHTPLPSNLGSQQIARGQSDDLKNEPIEDSSPEQSDEPAAVTHRVRDGDSLPGLAIRYLGSADRAPEIFAANQSLLSDPELLPIGALLKIPSRSGSSEPVPATQPKHSATRQF